MADTWTDPIDRVLGERISPSIWNSNIAANGRILGSHTHQTGVAGDGAYLPGTEPKSGVLASFIPLYLSNVSAGIWVSVANQTRFYRFYLPFRLSLGFITASVTTLQAGSTLGVGIYNSAGTVLLASGTVSSASIGVKRVTMSPTPVDLLPDHYLLAWTNTGAVAQGPLFAGASGFGVVMNDLAPVSGTGANTSAVGVLPATLGVLTAVDAQNIAVLSLGGA